MDIQLKRIYLDASATDGTRILVDRLWPRGLTKERAQVDAWLKELAPSTELRTWFDHAPEKWTEFKRRYFAELRARDEELEVLLNAARAGRVTLLYAATDEARNNAVALAEFLQRAGRRVRPRTGNAHT